MSINIRKVGTNHIGPLGKNLKNITENSNVDNAGPHIENEDMNILLMILNI